MCSWGRAKAKSDYPLSVKPRQQIPNCGWFHSAWTCRSHSIAVEKIRQTAQNNLTAFSDVLTENGDSMASNSRRLAEKKKKYIQTCLMGNLDHENAVLC